MFQLFDQIKQIRERACIKLPYYIENHFCIIVNIIDMRKGNVIVLRVSEYST